MTNYKEILRLKSLDLTNAEIASACGCGRNTVTRTLKRAEFVGIDYAAAKKLSAEEVTARLFPDSGSSLGYRMPEYAQVHKEMQKSGITLNLHWVEYCEQCRVAGELTYQSTQFNNCNK